MEGSQTEGAQQSTLAGRGGGSGVLSQPAPCSSVVHACFIKPAGSPSLRFPSLANVAMQWHCECVCV